ncbi:3-phosphoshikimate 1-carboxyvinyltransferase [Subsaxibacter sp. CAU 1640]|uniref:3-phosphoshikimate 1-carboxyvinyltransferase n=1 Tax=Subsaxibacter sp. CAU 1640 TaxID=2933271 RepID=UPI0020045A3E|nr:3-phosphoshikimate 1-carboxyvinyltransferase [Subsaxibacter sp. CAU 1640]MCK7590317.1 3-phosphoshikimate 1-carboxyvinyltransferase [Subsaxibacter sp. CAU 1640]
MVLKLHKSAITSSGAEITITGSKSESNRLLLLQALYPSIEILNLSNSDDSMVMQKALTTSESEIDIHHAGTAMRFLTAFFAIQEGREVILTGSSRMKERPIKILVDALNELGANISYVENEGFPPLKIKGSTLEKSKVSLPANVSSQYISALLLIAPKLKNGLQLTLIGKITSVPYINMTLELLNKKGVKTAFEGNLLTVHPQVEITNPKSLVESDWSSASYYYSMVALSPIGTEIKLSSYEPDSLQGDSVLAEIYQDYGVTSDFINNSIVLRKSSIENRQSKIEYDLSNSPDITQTIAVTCFGLGLGCHLKGLHTLKIKETDRLLALKTELEKLGASVNVTNDSLELETATNIKSDISITTYNDHRMAMAFAPLALKTSLQIHDAMVVSKSYPTFWDDLKSIGFKITQ